MDIDNIIRRMAGLPTLEDRVRRIEEHLGLDPMSIGTRPSDSDQHLPPTTQPPSRVEPPETDS